MQVGIKLISNLAGNNQFLMAGPFYKVYWKKNPLARMEQIIEKVIHSWLDPLRLGVLDDNATIVSRGGSRKSAPGGQPDLGHLHALRLGNKKGQGEGLFSLSWGFGGLPQENIAKNQMKWLPLGPIGPLFFILPQEII